MFYFIFSGLNIVNLNNITDFYLLKSLENEIKCYFDDLPKNMKPMVDSNDLVGKYTIN